MRSNQPALWSSRPPWWTKLRSVAFAARHITMQVGGGTYDSIPKEDYGL